MAQQVPTKFRYPFPDKLERMPGDDFECVGPSLTKQSEAEACDINSIMERYVNTGVLEHVRENAGRYADLPLQFDYQQAVNMVMESEKAFLAMPASIRARFENDPARFLAFAEEHPDDYLVQLGIVPEEQPALTPASASAPAAPAMAVEQPGLPGTDTPSEKATVRMKPGKK